MKEYVDILRNLLICFPAERQMRRSIPITSSTGEPKGRLRARRFRLTEELTSVQIRQTRGLSRFKGPNTSSGQKVG